MEILQKSCLVLTAIGAINWGLIGIFNLNLVTLLFADGSMLTRLVYTLIGICGIINAGLLFSRISHME